MEDVRFDKFAFAELLCKEATCQDFHFGTEETFWRQKLLREECEREAVAKMPVFDSLLTKLSQVQTKKQTNKINTPKTHWAHFF